MGRSTLLNELRSRIERGEIPPGQRLPSERDLSSEFKVSRIAVQGALRQLEHLGWIEKQPNRRPVVSSKAVANLSKPAAKAGRVAIWMIPDSQDIGGLMLLQGIRSALGERGIHVLVGGAGDSEHEFLLSVAQSDDVAGAIVWQTAYTPATAAYEAICRSGRPIVFVDREPMGDYEADVVSVNHWRSAGKAVQHLISLGHRRIAMVAWEDEASSIRDRVEAYRAALREADIPWREDYLIRVGDRGECYEPGAWENLLRKILALEAPPTAIFAANDQIAFHIREAATCLDIRIPEEISLVGFDWLMRWHPSGGDITTVAQPFFEIGTTAVRLLLDRIEGRIPIPRRHILLEGSLVIKKSTTIPLGQTHP